MVLKVSTESGDYSHLKVLWCMKISKRTNIPRDTIKSRRMLKSYVTADKMPGHGRKPKISFKAFSSLVRTTNVTARHLLDDLKKGGTSASVATLRYALKKWTSWRLQDALHSWPEETYASSMKWWNQTGTVTDLWTSCMSFVQMARLMTRRIPTTQSNMEVGHWWCRAV